MERDAVFLSYRSGDAGAQAGRLAEVLRRHFGEERIFFDVESIQGGQRFPDRIDEALGRARVVLVMMGSGWLTAPDEHGRRRIDDPDDWVHREVVEALSRGLEVIPVLVDGATMGPEKAYPGPLVGLPALQLMRLDHAHFAEHAERIRKRIATILSELGVETTSDPLHRARSTPLEQPPQGHVARRGHAYEAYPPDAVQELERLSRARDQGTPHERTQRQRRITELANRLARNAGPDDVLVGARLISRVGKGNYGTVWQAVNIETGEAQAVKIFDTDRLGLGTSLYHFRRGVRAMQHLKQVDGLPSTIVRLHSVEASGLAFSMEYLDDGDLTRVAQHGWSRRKKLELMQSVCRAVEFAHQNGVIHRDIKPANIVMKGGDPVLTDFDIADLLFAKTLSAQAAGTVNYSAPEALNGKSGGAPTVDVFSLGRLLHFLLLERDPQLMFEDVPTLDELDAEDPELVAIIRKCTLRRPDRRYSTVASLIDDLERYGRGSGAGLGVPRPGRTRREEAAEPQVRREQQATLPPRGNGAAGRGRSVSRHVGPRPGETFGRYQLLAPAGVGRPGEVWAAVRMDSPVPRLVSVKLSGTGYHESEETQRPFIDEAHITSLIHHPHVSDIYELGEEKGRLYLVTDWCDGASLRQLMDRIAHGRLEVGVAARIAADVAAGLHAAHEAEDSDGTKLQAVHRDVSPRNILISKNGHIKLTNFGVAKASRRLHRPAADDETLGELSYMAPEQLTSGHVDRRADIFSLGCVLYEMTVGQRPFGGQGVSSTVYQLLAMRVAPPGEIVQRYPPALAAIVQRAMAKDAEGRYQTAEDLCVALEAWLTSQEPRAGEHQLAAVLRETLGVELDEKSQRIHEAWATLRNPQAAHAHPVGDAPPTNPAAVIDRSREAAGQDGTAAQRVGNLSSWWLPVAAGLGVLALVAVLARGTLQPTQVVHPQRAAEPQRVTITVQTIPTHATIRIDGGDALPSPHTLEVAPSRALHELSASAPNFTTVTRQVAFDQSRLVVIELERR